jgi:HAD superfamily hydrolase (TIGR01509 family)
MKWIKDFTFFLFDFDGLLVNTEHIHYQAYINTCSQRGFNLDWSFNEFCSIAHTSSEGLKEAIYGKFPTLQQTVPSWADLYKEKKQEYFSLIQSSKVELMPGVSSLINELHKENIKTCVVTNSLKEQTDLIKSRSDCLKKIQHWVTREDYEKAKPSPDGYLRAIELYGKKGDKIIGFEDSIRGLKSLVQTPAVSVLICSNDHPQMQGVLPEKTIYFSSFEGISSL